MIILQRSLFLFSLLFYFVLVGDTFYEFYTKLLNKQDRPIFANSQHVFDFFVPKDLTERLAGVKLVGSLPALQYVEI